MSLNGLATAGGNSNRSCNVCGSSATTPFFELEKLPVHVGNLYDDPVSARSAARGNICLTYCHRCKHIFNQSFRSDLLAYRPGYEAALYHSPFFRDFIHSVAERLRDKYQLQKKTVVEIGAGSGWFLELLCRLGGNNGIGIDPTISKPGVYDYEHFQVELIQDRFDLRFEHKMEKCKPDLVCCLSVLEHVADARSLVSDLRCILGNRRPGIYFEVFNAFRAFRQNEIWSIHYEQCHYFSQQSIQQLFTSCGFEILESGGCYGDNQYLFVDCIPALENPPEASDFFELAADDKERYAHNQSHELPQEITQFAQIFDARCQIWQTRFERFRTEAKRVAFWGAGGKGVTFLNVCPGASMIDVVAEINPAKHGKYIPGSGHKIVAPEELLKCGTDAIIISNALYEKEIREQAQAIGLRSEIHVA